MEEEEDLNKNKEPDDPIKTGKAKVGQEQIHGLLFGDKLSWQAIIYDLINSEQLDPWDIDICMLSNKYLEKVRQLEEANFFVSSKVLLAASLLLRIKSEILLNHYLPSLDEILFGEKEEKHFLQERIELDEEIPELVPRTPLPRGRKVTLQELMAALGKAITTETRRIKKVVIDKQREFETAIVLPRRIVDLKEQINLVYGKLKKTFKETGEEKIAFSDFSGESADEKISHFVPLLHLDYQHKIFVEQEKCFDEIWVWLKEVHQNKHADMLEIMRKEAEEAMKEDVEREEKEFAEEKELKKMKKNKLKKRKDNKKEESKITDNKEGGEIQEDEGVFESIEDDFKQDRFDLKENIKSEIEE